MVIWALFDSETATVAKALPEHEVHSFGIGSGTEHIHLDLSDFETAVKELEKYPKPDAIFASPPCESWVDLSKGHLPKYTNEAGFNLHWKNKWTAFDFLPKFKETRINGCRTAEITATIIQHFKPDFWAIENGRKSIIFDYMREFANLKGIKNFCNYFSYGFDVLKNTIIYSNALLLLKKENPNRIMPRNVRNMPSSLRLIARKKDSLKNGRVTIDGYTERSKVPPLLYKDIMRQFQHGGQKTLFPMEEIYG